MMVSEGLRVIKLGLSHSIIPDMIVQKAEEQTWQFFARSETNSTSAMVLHDAHALQAGRCSAVHHHGQLRRKQHQHR